MLLTDDVPKGFIRALLLPLINELLPFTDDDQDAAWEAAEAATMSLNPQTVNEFRLAARVALFNILGNRLTAAASAPNLTPACSIRMRNCALSYVREADKTERRLENLQAGRPKEEKADTTQTMAKAATQAKSATALTKTATAQPESAATSAQATAAKALPASIPAYKLLKQQRRLAKQQEREARLKAQAEQVQNVPMAA